MRNEFDDRSTGEDLTREFWGAHQDWQPDPTPKMGTARRSGDTAPPDTGMTGAIRAVKDSWAAFRPTTADRASKAADRSGALPRTRQHGVVDPNRPLTPPRGSQRPEPAPSRRKRVAANELSIGDLGAGRSASLSLDAWDAIDDWSELDDLTARHEALRLSRQHRDDVRSGVTPQIDERRPTPRAAGQARPTAMAAFNDAPLDDDDFDDAYQVPLSTQIAERFGWRGADPLLVKGLGAVLLTLVLLPLIWSRGDSDSTPVGQEIDAPSALVSDTSATATATLPPNTAAAAVVATATSAPQTPAADANATSSDTNSAASGSTNSAASSSNTATTTTTAAPKKAASSTNTSTTAAAKPKAGDSGSKTEADKPAERVIPKCDQSYKAVAGDSWWGIAERADTSLNKLLGENNATADTVILPGDKICIPSGAKVPTSATTTTTEAPSSDNKTTTTTAPATTTTTEAKVTTTTSAPSNSGSPGRNATPEQVKQVIRDVFPDELEAKALDIAYRESRYIPTADNNFCCHGVFQIYYSVHKSWLKNLGINSVDDLYDPVLNAKAALELYRRAGNSWSPWTTA